MNRILRALNDNKWAMEPMVLDQLVAVVLRHADGEKLKAEEIDAILATRAARDEREEGRVIADADNDRGMMEWAGFAVAVGNATDQVKQLADAVVPSNDDQGVARAIHRYILTRR